MKKLVVGFLMIVFVSLLFVVWQSIGFMYRPSSVASGPVVFDVTRGMTIREVAQRLASAGLVSDGFKLRVLARVMGVESKIRVGEYQLRPNMKPTEILEIIVAGKSIGRPITFQEGINMFEMGAYLEAKGLLSGKEFLKTCHDQQFIKAILGRPLESLEGYLFPETYHITKFTTVKELVTQMVHRFQGVFHEIQRNNGESSLSTHEIVTLASIIEKETGAAKERPLISSVFHNRLKKSMRLQSDPTILYGILKKTGVMKKNIRKADILAYSKYNTYRVNGIPFGPIANPGAKSLEAVFGPDKSNFLYFVSRNDGTHYFSPTFAEHNRAVKRFQLNRKARAGKSWRDLDKTQR